MHAHKYIHVPSRQTAATSAPEHPSVTAASISGVVYSSKAAIYT